MKKQVLLFLFLVFFTISGFSQSFFEGFENNTGPDAPPGISWTLGSGDWAVFDNGVGTGQRWGINNTLSYQGTNAAYTQNENIGQGNTAADYLATPLVTIPDDGILKFRCRTLAAGNQGTIYRIMVANGNNAGNQTNPSAYTLAQEWTENALTATFDSYEEKTVSLSAYTGQQVYIAFVQLFQQPTAVTGGDPWLIDNVEITTFCPAPTTLTVTNVTSTSVVLGWTSSSAATQWHVLVLPVGIPAPLPTTVGWVASSSNPFVITGLSPHSAYDFYVRSVCAEGVVSDWSNLVTATTLSAPPICGGNYVDSGDMNFNYANNEDNTITTCPTVPGEVVRVTFVSFNTEAEHDALYVYNGSSIAAAQISSPNPAGNVPGGQPGGYWGNTIPGPFTSTTMDGCLTFRFRSDATTTLGGWTANVDCIPVICEIPTGLAVSSITQNAVTLTWDAANTSFPTVIGVMLYSDGIPYTYTVNAISNNIILPLPSDHCYTASIRKPCNSTLGMSEWSEPVSFCTVTCENNAECPQSLVLNAFLDSNNNGVKDSGEIDFNYGAFVYQINDVGMPQYGYTNNGTYFIFDQDPANSYDISFVVNNQLSSYYSCSLSHNDITIPTNSGATHLYFPVVMTQPYQDVQVGMYPIGQPRPGFNYSNVIYYQNNSLQTIANGTVTFTKDANVSISSISQPGTTPTSDGFTYAFTDLAPFEARYITVELSVPTIPAVNLGQVLINTAAIQIANDTNLDNNTVTFNQIVVGSYDPNDKSESHGGKIVLDDFTANDYLYYTVQFENTGTANAEFIRVEDALDNQLDETTFEMLSASAAVNTKREGNQLIWHFYNINLPPTSTNPAESHGYVHFRIKPKTGYALGTSIPNTASIYFDYNPPIVTNTFNTEFVESLGTPSFSANHIGLYPNPASNLITIANQNTTESIASISIYDVSGKRIYTSNSIYKETTIDVSPFAKGLYLVEIISENNTKITKKLILK